MEGEKMSFVSWIKRHKTELIIAGVSITTITAIVLGIKNRQALEESWASLQKLVQKIPNNMPITKETPSPNIGPIDRNVKIDIPFRRHPHNVSSHIRLLPNGCKASVEKIKTAYKFRYELREGETWVKPYRTGGNAA